MRETVNGGDVIWMPRGRADAATKLGKLSALAASREWERAALITLLVKVGKGGRPKKGVTRNTNTGDQAQYTMAEFIRLGIYGFRTHNSIRAYLKAWSLSGLAAPEWGSKIALPSGEFPDTAEIYSLKPDEDQPQPAPAVGPSGEDDTDDDTEDDDEAGKSPLQRSAGPSKPKPERTMLDTFLAVLDKTDPSAVLHGQPADRRELLIKTLRSWLESLEELAQEEAE